MDGGENMDSTLIWAHAHNKHITPKTQLKSTPTVSTLTVSWHICTRWINIYFQILYFHNAQPVTPAVASSNSSKLIG